MLPTEQVTGLLRQWAAGDVGAYNELFPVLYEHLRRLAGRVLAQENPNNTVSATVLVHEAYLKMMDVQVEWNDRVHFFSIAARVMRRIMVDNARGAAADKRGGGRLRLSLQEEIVAGSSPDDSLLILDDALTRLGSVDGRKANVIELAYFGGMTVPEIGGALGVSEATILRDLRFAKAWLRKEMTL